MTKYGIAYKGPDFLFPFKDIGNGTTSMVASFGSLEAATASLETTPPLVWIFGNGGLALADFAIHGKTDWMVNRSSHDIDF